MGRDSQLDWPAVLPVPETEPPPGDRPASLSWRQTARAVLPAFLITRLLTFLAGVVAIQAWGVKPVQDVYDPAGLTTKLGGTFQDLFGPYIRWDAVWFLDIAGVGYPTSYAPRTAFFPLYPVLVNVGGFLVRSPMVAGLLLSLACAYAGAMLVHRLTDMELGRRSAGMAVWALLAFPGSLWLTAVYSEGLFLLLSAGCLYAARRRRWPLAALCGVLAALTRSAGIVLVVPLLVVAWQTHRADVRARRQSDPRD
ncbi:mannosyltransferase family protein, partial [Patulibacter sp. S7RM1-6]